MNAIIFDLDGVLCHTDEYHYMAWKAIADELHIPFNREVNNQLRGVSRMESLKLILRNSPVRYSEQEKFLLAEKKNNIYRELLQNITSTDLADGAWTVLEKLHAIHIPLTIEQGKGRFVMMDEAMWGMILGKSGKIPGTIAPELVELAQKQGREFTDVDAHTLLTDALDDFRKEMDENGWEYGQDDEELFELAMHPEQYRNFKSGQAKKNFLADLQKAKDAKMGSQLSAEQLAAFKHAKADAIVCPVKGQLFWEFQGDGEAAPAVEPFIGKEYKEGDAFCYIQAPWGEFVEVKADLGGKLVEINAKQGAKVRKGDVIAYIQRPEADA